MSQLITKEQQVKNAQFVCNLLAIISSTLGLSLSMDVIHDVWHMHYVAPVLIFVVVCHFISVYIWLGIHKHGKDMEV